LIEIEAAASGGAPQNKDGRVLDHRGLERDARTPFGVHDLDYSVNASTDDINSKKTLRR
jgi:hypothetical protein